MALCPFWQDMMQGSVTGCAGVGRRLEFAHDCQIQSRLALANQLGRHGNNVRFFFRHLFLIVLSFGKVRQIKQTN